MANTEQIQDRVRVQLERWGYIVEPIQVAASGRRAEFVATVDDECIVVEVTSKNDDGQYERDLRNLMTMYDGLMLAAMSTTRLS